MLLLVVARLFQIRIYKRLVAKRDTSRWQMKAYAANSAISGVMWGTAGVLFYVPNDIELQLYVFMVLVFKGAGSATAVSSYLPAFYLYFPTSMVPITVLLLFGGNMTSLLWGVTSLGFIIIMLYFGRNFNSTLVESLRLRYENEHLLAEAKREKENAELANQAKSKFLAAASHDLRQPLHALSLFSSILSDTTLTKKQLGLVNNINKSLQSLENLLDSLLDISHLDSGSVTPTELNFSLQTILQRLKNDYSVEADKKKLQLIWTDEDLYLRSDPQLFEQVLRNLVGNAIRYTDRGEVRIQASKHSDLIEISVIDTGIGIEPDLQQKVFEEFFQAHNPERERQKGLGLGLAIVKRTLDILQSQFTLNSQVGIGTTFSFTIKAGAPTGYFNPGSTSQQAPAKLPLNLKIAILEDDPEAAEALQLSVVNWGCTVINASNLSALLEIIQTTQFIPDLLISDLQLRDGEIGWQSALQLQHQLKQSLPAIFITGNIQIKSNDIDYPKFLLLYKPVAPAKLRAYLNGIQRDLNLQLRL